MVKNHYVRAATESVLGDEDASWLDTDRLRGVLTPDDRKYFLGDRTDEGTARDTRYRIRKRVVASLLDIPIVARSLAKDDRNKIVEHLEDSATEVVVSGFQFFYELGQSLEAQDRFDDDLTQELLAEGVSRAVTDTESIPRVTASINIKQEKPALDEIEHTIEIDQATPDEYLYYATHGDIESILEKRAEQGRSLFLRTPEWSPEKIIELDPAQELEKYRRVSNE